jgi:hypothetical protein
MPTWMKCTTTDGTEIRINLDHVVTIRPYQRDRGGKGSEITFVGGSPSSLVVKEDQDRIASSRQKSTTDRVAAGPRRIAGRTSSAREETATSGARSAAPSMTDVRNPHDQGAS